MKKSIIAPLTAFFVLASIVSFSQEDSKILYLDQLFKVTADASAPYKLELKKVAGETFSGMVYDYAGIVKSKGTYIRVGDRYLEDGHFTFFYQNGQIESEGEYDRGVKVGIWKRFDNTGKRKGDKYYPAESADKIRATMMLEKNE